MTTKTLAAPAVEAEAPVAVKDTATTLTWKEWKKRWRETTNLSELLGLIHCLFETEVDNHAEIAERIITCCDLADGHCESSMDKPYKSPVQQRKKAFEVLARNVFRDRGERDYDKVTALEGLMRQPPAVLEKVLWFFRPVESRLRGSEEEGCWLHNLQGWFGSERNQPMDLATALFIKLSKAIWTQHFPSNVHRRDSNFNKETVELAKMRRVQVLEMAHAYKKSFVLNLLLWSSDRVVSEISWDAFDEDCLKRLKEFALAQAFYPPDWPRDMQKPVTVEEAAYGGSSAAQLYLLCRSAHKEKKRLEQIAEAKRTAAEATRTLEKLQKA